MTKKFNRADFDSGSFELNVYLKKTARQHSSKEISKTFVIIDDEKENRFDPR
ncbi:GCN5-related N-acetyltransferase (fragment) [Candidatus Desulfarcum epimagneticum]|uniref:GCN5-related N-acetyltransferase n=1 Tax=uncultured Desulfobacteraceae bacterium TaxID=218296 RepID=A0A484HKE1_9BACT